jgi:hypothetical protein
MRPSGIGPRFQNPWFRLQILLFPDPGTLGLKQREAGVTPTLLRAKAITELPDIQQESGTDTSIVPVTAAVGSAVAVTCTLEPPVALAAAAAVAAGALLRAETPLHVASMLALTFHLPFT